MGKSCNFHRETDEALRVSHHRRAGIIEHG
jgi:hypothetical protein